jgi:anti-repressor protein
MEDLVKIFRYEDQEVRVVKINDESWWVLKDICDVLELSNPSMVANRLDEDERTKIDPKYYLGSHSNELTTVINESGLYNIILLSRKPEAKQFKRWVTHEVLPSIRKHGMYATPATIEAMLQDPDTMIKTLQELKKERFMRKIAETQLEKDKPYTSFAKAIETSKGGLLLGQYAKVLRNDNINVGAVTLFKWMRDNGYLIKSGQAKNNPKQQYINAGYFIVKEVPISHYGKIATTTLITGKGQRYFLPKLKEAFGQLQGNVVMI